jgi:hypothetical protein
MSVSTAVYTQSMVSTFIPLFKNLHSQMIKRDAFSKRAREVSRYKRPSRHDIIVELVEQNNEVANSFKQP